LKQFMKQRAAVGKDTVKFVGQDHLGNRYFEAYRPNHIRPVQRYFDRTGMQRTQDVVDIANVPPLWDAWLRFRRQEPPTDDELKDSEEYYRMQQERAANSKAHKEEKEEMSKDTVSDKSKKPPG
jgi:NADH dehydrogenase [ubiquinone] 1 alpha subcomplex assembly factor 2